MAMDINQKLGKQEAAAKFLKSLRVAQDVIESGAPISPCFRMQIAEGAYKFVLDCSNRELLEVLAVVRRAAEKDAGLTN